MATFPKSYNTTAQDGKGFLKAVLLGFGGLLGCAALNQIAALLS